MAELHGSIGGGRVAVAAARYFIPTFLAGQSRWPVGSTLDEKRLAYIAEQTAQDYQYDFLPFLNQLASAYHFRVVIFWQPTLFTESKRIGEENLLGNIEPFCNDKKAAQFFREIYRFIRTDVERNFYNISDALAGRTKECYADWVHLSEDCNLTVAKKIVDILRTNYLQ